MGNHKKYSFCYDRSTYGGRNSEGDTAYAVISRIVLYSAHHCGRAELSVFSAGCDFCPRQTEAWDIDDPEDYVLYMDVERDLFFLIDL